MTDSIYNVVVYGAGLAGQMTALALSQSLPSRYNISLIQDDTLNTDCEVLYGNLCAPTSYDFHRSLGLSEPDLLFNSDAAFSYGSHYHQWGRRQRNWVQCFHLPLPVQESVEFHQSLLRAGIQNLEPYLVSAQAARRGVFAHPPQDPKIPLSRAEYGYHVSTSEYLGAVSNILDKTKHQKVKRIKTDSLTAFSDEKGIDYLLLSDGQKIEADLFIDCSGSKASLISNLEPQLVAKRTINYLSSGIDEADINTDQFSQSANNVTAFEFGWQSETAFRGKSARLTLFTTDANSAYEKHGKSELSGAVELGCLEQAWLKNCVAIGHAASIIEPLTQAPMIMLQRDIERLLELIPVSQDAKVERTEFNRRFALDYEHASIFNDAFYQCDDLPETDFWQYASALKMNQKLKIKLEQFENRAIITMFDLEPFNEQDWLILHFGMQRKPARYSRFAERHSSERLTNWFNSIERDINAIVKKMPPSERYATKMLDYLRTQS